MQNNIWTYVLANKHLLLYRDFIIEILNETVRTPAVRIEDDVYRIDTAAPVYVGKLVVDGFRVLSVAEILPKDVHYYNDSTYYPTEEQLLRMDGSKVRAITSTFVKLTDIEVDDEERLIHFDEPVTIQTGDIFNYRGNAPLDTSFGRFFLNYTLLVDSFGDVIPFIDDYVDPKKLESQITALAFAKTLTIDQVQKYTRRVFFIGQFTELCVPVFSRKSLTTSPKVKETRDKLTAEHAEEIANGDAVVMSMIEKILVDLDKEYMEHDPAMGFLGTSGSLFNIKRKAMFLTGGMVEKFGSPGQFAFVGNSLSEGWNPKDLPTIINNIRSGSFSRALETAKGGEESKFLMRVFQNMRIVEEDCQSPLTLTATLTSSTYSKFVYRTIIENGVYVILTPDVIKAYIGKTVQLRSPMYCKCKTGLCYTCTGEVYRNLSQENLALLATAVGARFLTMSLKKMHGSAHSTVVVTSLNQFCL